MADTDKDKGPEVVSSPALVENPNPTPPSTAAVTGPVNKGDEELHAEATAPVDQAPAAVINPKPATKVVAVETKPMKEEPPRGKAKFLKLTGVKDEDLIGYNPNNLTGVTAQGGKYQMNSKGTQIRHLAGPRPPSVTDEEAAAEEEARKEAAENARAARGE